MKNQNYSGKRYQLRHRIICLFAFLALMTSASFAQVTVLVDPATNGGFEVGSGSFADNGWIVASGVATNQWFTQDNTNANPASPFAGSKCAYISSNGFGTTYDYNNTSPSTVYFYRDIAFPAGKTRITISMYYKAVGQSFLDRAFVCYTSTANTPVTNDFLSSTPPQYATSVANSAQGGFNAWPPVFTPGWVLKTFLLPGSFAGTTQRIIFGWQNDASGGTSPGGAFDNISITAEPPINCTVNTNGGLWSDPDTWVGGLFPSAGDNVIVPDGVTLTVDGTGNSLAAGAICNNLTIGGGVSGILNFISAFNALAINGNLTVNNGAKLNGFTQAAIPGPNSGGGVTINVAGNININSGGSVCMAHSAAILNMNGTSPQSINGPGTFLGGIVRNLRISNPTSVTLNVPITINNTSGSTGMEHYAGNLVTNGNLTLDATACYNDATISQTVFTVVVNDMGSNYTSQPTVTCGVPWTPGRGVGLATTVISGGNIFAVTIAGTLGATPPTATNGPQVNGTATLVLSGTEATAVANWDPVSLKVRTITVTSPGSGYHLNLPIRVNDSIVPPGGVIAKGTCVVLQSIQGSQFGTFYDRNGGTTITGALNINNTQNIGGITVQSVSSPANPTNLNYSTAPTVGFGVPVRTFLTTNPGAGYTTATVAFAYPSGTITTAPTATATVVNGKVTSIVITGGGVFVGGTGTVNVAIIGANTTQALVADLSIPVAAASINNGMISGFTMTAFGADYVVAPTVTLGTVAGAIAPAAANVTCRPGLYTVRYQTNTAVWPNVGGLTEGTEIPANRKLNNLTINNANLGITLNNNLELTAAATAFSATSGVISFSGANNTITCSNPAYAGTSQSTLATALSWVEGKFTVTTPGGSVTRTFPMARHGFQISTGTGSGAAGPSGGSDITSVTGQADVAPTGSITPGYNFIMNRTYKLTINTPGSQFGTGPTAGLIGNTDDNLASDIPNIHVVQAPGTTGPWDVRSISAGTGVITGSFTKTTSPTSPGPIVYGSPTYFTWATTFVPPPPLNYNITRTTGNTYTSVFPGSSPLPGPWGGSGATEQQFSSPLSLPGTTFQFQGSAVTGIKVGLDGYMTFNTAYTSNLSSPNLGGSATGITNITKTLAPFWGNLACTPNDFTAATRDISIRYRIDGTLGSGNAIINIEWIHMGGSGNPVQNTGSDLNFQVQLFEGTNIIKYNYGLMKGFDGSNKVPWNYACGMNGGFVSGFPAPGQALALQEHDENTTNFTNHGLTSAGRGAHALHTVPECYSSYIFNPNIAPVPFVPGSGIPANDNPAGAITLTELPAPPADYCGAIYSSFGATPTAPANACAGTSSHSDVWFQFTATDPMTAVKVVSSGGYDAVVQVFDASLNSLAACTNATTDGNSEVAVVSGLTIGNTYYVRVFHNLTGTQATATAVVTEGSVTAINLTNPGSGYGIPAGSSNATPRVRVTGTGSGAVITSLPTGTFAIPSGITGFTINSTGSGYTSAPTITIDPPSAGLTGDFGIAVYANSPPPANDGICSATALTVTTATCNPTAGTTIGATATGGIPICTGNADDDVFYSFVAPAGGNPITILLQGSASFDAVMQILTSNNNLCSGTLTSFGCINAASAGGLEAVTFSSLIAGQTYFVRVYHATAGAGSGTFTICVFESGPPCPNMISPPDGSLAYVGGTTLKWNASTGVTGYDVYFSTVQADVINGAPAALVSSNQAGLTYATGALTNGTVYYWRVDARNVIGPSVGCTVRSFTGTTNLIIGSDATVCSGNFYDSGGPSVSYQDNENSTTTICPATVGTSSSVTFTSFGTSTLLNDADALFIYNGPTIASPQFAGSPFAGNLNPTGITSTDNSGCITFRFTSDGNSSTGPGWSATVNCVIACTPSPTSPTNGGNLCAVANNTLSWPVNPSATGYDVFLDNNINPTTLVSSNQAGNTYNTGALAIGTYYWKVVSRNGAIVCLNPTVWSFTVRPLPTPNANNSSPVCSGTPLGLFGSNLTSGQSTGNSFSWTGPNSFTSIQQNPVIGSATSVNAGIYTLSVINQYGCTAPTTTTNVIVNPNPVLSVTSVLNEVCVGAMDGCIDVDATIGTSPYLYDLNGNSTLDGNYCGLGAGIYTVTVIDDNSCESSINVTVVQEDNVDPTISCPPTVMVHTDPGVCYATNVNLGNPSYADNCGGLLGIANNAPVQYPQGGVIVQWEVTDLEGNKASCNQMVAIQDLELPVALCKNICVYLGSNGLATITGADIDNGSHDNCGIASLTATPSSFSFADAGPNTVILTVLDVNGNSSTCTATVTVGEYYSIFGADNNCVPPSGSNTGCRVNIGNGNTINGNVGSYRLIETGGGVVINGKVVSGGKVSFANGVSSKGISAANLLGVSGNILSTGNSAQITGDVDVTGNVYINQNGGSFVTGTVRHPSGTTYSGPVAGGGVLTAPPVLPALPGMPTINLYSCGGTNITTTATLTPGYYGNLTLGNQSGVVITFNGAGDYYFSSIKMGQGGIHTFKYNFNNLPGKIRIFVCGDIDFGQYEALWDGPNTPDACRVYFETHGTGSTNGTNSTMSCIIGLGSHFYGRVWAPYGGISAGSGSCCTYATGSLWSAKQVKLEGAVTFNGCSSSCPPAPKIGQETTATDAGMNDKLQVYPNPTSGKTTVSFFTETPDNYSFKVMDYQGRIVLNNQIKSIAGDNTMEVDMSQFAKGLYMIEVGNTDHSQKVKLVVQ